MSEKKHRLKKIFSAFREWSEFLPISKREYFYHVILILDCIMILIRISYETLLPFGVNRGVLIFDIGVVTLWGFDFIRRVRKSENKLDYSWNRWYNILGLFPFPVFRLFLLLITLKQAIIAYKYIKRGEKNRELFLDRELNFSFQNIIADSISDIIFLNALKRVEEVMSRLEYDKMTQEIFQRNRESIHKAVGDSLISKDFIGRLNSLPLLKGITGQLAEELTLIIIETIEAEVIGKVLKEINLFILREMVQHVKELDFDRITEGQKKV